MVLKKKERRVQARHVTTKEYPRLTFTQALDVVISTKRVEGVRERTLRDYEKDYGTGLADTTINIRLRVLKALFN